MVACSNLEIYSAHHSGLSKLSRTNQNGPTTIIAGCLLMCSDVQLPFQAYDAGEPKPVMWV